MTINAINGAKNGSNQSDMRNPVKKSITGVGSTSTNNLGLKSTTGESKRRRSDGQNIGTRPNPK
jgi:hypothetical protein